MADYTGVVVLYLFLIVFTIHAEQPHNSAIIQLVESKIKLPTSLAPNDSANIINNSADTIPPIRNAITIIFSPPS